MNLILCLIIFLSFFSNKVLAAVAYRGSHPIAWSGQEVPVCWENSPDGSNIYKEVTREAIEQSWEKYSTLKFIGWGNCNNNSRGIRIQIADDNPHTKGLGRELNGKKNGMLLNFTFQKWSQSCAYNKESCVASIGVHEFGHAVGFTHEHNRGDRDPMCKEEPQGPDGNAFLTPYDGESVMNYCNPEYNNDGQLSDADIAGIQLLYGIPCENWLPPKKNTIRLYKGQRVRAMIPFKKGLVTAFQQGGIYYSPDGADPAKACSNTQKVYNGKQKVLAMIPYKSGIITAFSGGAIYYSPDGKNLGGGGKSKKVYNGNQKVSAMIPWKEGVITAFSGGGIYFSPDGKNLGGNGKTKLIYRSNQNVLAMSPYKKGYVTAFSGGGIYFTSSGKYPAGGGDSIVLYNGRQTLQTMIPYKKGLITAFSEGGVYFSPNGKDIGGRGKTKNIYGGQQKATAISIFKSGIVSAFQGGGIYYSPNLDYVGGYNGGY